MSLAHEYKRDLRILLANSDAWYLQAFFRHWRSDSFFLNDHARPSYISISVKVV
jgi:hypothetical protein